MTPYGDYRCCRAHYFKAKKTRLLSMKVTVLDRGEYEKRDPEATFALSTVRE